MDMPFTTDQFLEVFGNYNKAVWPLQIVFYAMAIFLIYLGVRKTTYGNKTITGTLVFFWLWMGIVYHLLFFSPINKAAYIFGALFILQSMLFLYYGIFYSKLSFHFRPDIYGLTGALFILYALIIYPLLGHFYGHVYPNSPTFGLPCPTTIFTFGILLWTDKKLPLPILIIPFLWSLLGPSAALKMGIREDYGLFITGVISCVMILRRNRFV